MDSAEDSYLSTSLSWPYMTWAEKNSSEQNYSRSKSQKFQKPKSATLAGHPDPGGTTEDNNHMKDLLIYIVKSFSPNITTSSNTNQILNDFLSSNENHEALLENVKAENPNNPAHETNLTKKEPSKSKQDSNNKTKIMNDGTSKYVKTKVNNNRTQDLKKPILKKKRPVISFFDDITSPSRNNPIEIQNLSSISIKNPIEIQSFPYLDRNFRDEKKTISQKSKTYQRKSKTPKQNKHLKQNDMVSKITTYKKSIEKSIEQDATEIERKITEEISSIRRTLDNQAFAKFDPTTPFEDWDIPSSLNVSSNENETEVALLEQPAEDKNGGIKAFEDGRQSYFRGNKENDRCLETYWNRTDMSFKFISKVFNILPPSKKVFDDFVEAAKKNNSRDKKSKINNEEPASAIGKILPLRYFDQKTNVDQKKCINREAQCTSNQREKCKTKQTQCSFTQKEQSKTPIEKELCPDNMNLIKMAISKEIAKRIASNGQRDGISLEDFEKLVQEQVTSIINEIRAQKTNFEGNANGGDQKNVHVYNMCRPIMSRSKRINNLNRTSIGFHEIQKENHHASKEHRRTPTKLRQYEKPKSRTTKLPEKKPDPVSMEYNRALKRFQQNLLKSDTDCSVLTKTCLPQKVRSLHYLKYSRTSSRNQYDRKRETRTKVRGKSNEDGFRAREIIMQNRKHEVEEKLKNSKNRTRPSQEKKAIDKTDRMKELTHQKLKRETTKSIQKSILKHPQKKFYEPGRKISGPAHLKRDSDKVIIKSKCLKELFDTVSSSYCSNNEEVKTRNNNMTQRVDKHNNNTNETNEKQSMDSKTQLLKHSGLPEMTSNDSISKRENLFRSFSINIEDIFLTSASECSHYPLGIKNQKKERKTQ
ncbi:hypothetical protein WDU94_008009 [Cyamophila willieti]